MPEKPIQSERRAAVRDILTRNGGLALAAAGQYAAAFSDEELSAVEQIQDPKPSKVYGVITAHNERIAAERNAASAEEQDKAAKKKPAAAREGEAPAAPPPAKKKPAKKKPAEKA